MTKSPPGFKNEKSGTVAVGIDEIAVYVPDKSNPRVVVYQLQHGGTGSAEWWDSVK